MRVRLNLFPAVTKKSVSPTTKVKASIVTVTVATRDNPAVSNPEFNAESEFRITYCGVEIGRAHV